MASILKVDKIRGTGLDSDSFSIDGSGNITTIKTLHAPGHVLQVVQGGRVTRVAHNSNTFTDVGVSATITPKSTSSKILVRLEGTIGNSNAGNLTALKLFRDSTEIGSGTGADSYNHFFGYLSSASYTLSAVSQSILDSPSTTSAITYKIQMAAFNATGSLGGRGDGNSIANPTRLTLMEIAQ